MEGTIVMQTRSLVLNHVCRKNNRIRKSPIRCVLTRPVHEAEKKATMKTIYKDNWFNHVAITHLSQAVQSTTGLCNTKKGYESLVEAASATSRNFSLTEQRELIMQALDKAFPKPILAVIRTLLPNSKFTREYFAIFTTMFFTWLIGPSEVRESELNGVRERNVVYIKKCRFLEESNCVGMCTNLCKMSSQTFIKDSFGIPVYMVPNFEDMSCEMIYGQDPPSITEDPAFRQPCYELCKTKKSHKIACPN